MANREMFHVPKETPKGKERNSFLFQKAILRAYGVAAPRKLIGPVIYAEAPNPGADPMWDACNEVRRQIHALMGRKGMFTQGWMRSALFLGTVSVLKGNEGLDMVKEAVWAYTAALIEGVGKICDNPDILKDVPRGRRFDAYKVLLTELRRSIEDQMRLLKDIGDAKAEYERNEPALEYGRLLLKAVHALDTDSTGRSYQGLCRKIGELGPGAVPTTDWDAAVMIAKSILFYEARRQARNAPENGESKDTEGNHAADAEIAV